MKRCFGIDSLVFRLLHSNQSGTTERSEERRRGKERSDTVLDNIELGRRLYEELPTTTVPLSLYLDKIGKISPELNVKILYIADLLNNHKV